MAHLRAPAAWLAAAPGGGCDVFCCVQNPSPSGCVMKQTLAYHRNRPDPARGRSVRATGGALRRRVRLPGVGVVEVTGEPDFRSGSGCVFDAEGDCYDPGGGGGVGPTGTTSCDYRDDPDCVRPIEPAAQHFVQQAVDGILTNNPNEAIRTTCLNAQIAYGQALNLGRIGVGKYSLDSDNHDAASYVNPYRITYKMASTSNDSSWSRCLCGRDQIPSGSRQ